MTGSTTPLLAESFPSVAFLRERTQFVKTRAGQEWPKDLRIGPGDTPASFFPSFVASPAYCRSVQSALFSTIIRSQLWTYIFGGVKKGDRTCHCFRATYQRGTVFK